MIEAVKLLAATKVAEAEKAYQLVGETFPEESWSFRIKELDSVVRTLREYNALGSMPVGPAISTSTRSAGCRSTA